MIITPHLLNPVCTVYTVCIVCKVVFMESGHHHYHPHINNQVICILKIEYRIIYLCFLWIKEVGSVYSGMETMRVGDMRAMRAQPDYAIINDNSSPLPPPPSSNDGRQDMVDNGSMIGLPPPPTQWVVNDVSL